MMSDASEMLAAALEQMDGIIAGKRLLHTQAAHTQLSVRQIPLQYLTMKQEISAGV